MAAAVPGRLASDIARTIDEVMINAGYAEYCRQPYMRSRGHAMGFGAIIPRDLAPDNHTVLREGMAFVIHPNQYIPETGYLMAGDTVVLEPTGPTRLTQTPLQLFWKDI